MVSLPQTPCWIGGADGLDSTTVYTYDDGDNLLRKVAPFLDDFSDNNYTSNSAWSQLSAGWSAASGYMANTSGGSWQYFTKDLDFEECVVDFSYRNRDTSESLNRIEVHLEDTGASAQVKAAFKSSGMELYQTSTSIDYNGDDSTEDQWYDCRIVLDGSHVEVWRAESGETLELVLESDAVTSSGYDRIRFYVSAGAVFDFDNIDFRTPDPHTVTYAYNDANELTKTAEDMDTTAFAYDDWGRTISKTRAADSLAAVYNYRYGHKLKDVTTNWPGETDVSYMYDGLGKRRIVYPDFNGSGEMTWYRYGLGWKAIAQYEDDDTAFWDIGGRTKSYLPGLGEVTGTNPSTGTYRYYSIDHLGSIRRIRDASKTSLASYEYTPYGNEYHHTGLPLDHGYTGHKWDAEVGMYYAPYRYYTPGNARWMKRDPLRYVDGPNMYGYVRGNPIAYRDEDGRLLGLCIVGAGLIGGYFLVDKISDFMDDATEVVDDNYSGEWDDPADQLNDAYGDWFDTAKDAYDMAEDVGPLPSPFLPPTSAKDIVIDIATDAVTDILVDATGGEDCD